MRKETSLEILRRELRRLKRLAEAALAQVDDRAFFADLGRDENSLAIVVKHLAGNLRSRWRDFLTTDGEKADRLRDTEFLRAGDDSRESLLASWESGWTLLFEALDPLTVEDLDRIVAIRGEALTVHQAVTRQLVHYSYHVGQIVFLARHWVGGDWQSLSVPRGESARFNERPASYLTRPTSADSTGSDEAL